jgi:hypothetical protein
MAKKWTLANAVKKFKPNLKASLKRNNGNLNVREFESLKKEMKCYYEEVEEEGKGRDRIIITDKKRKEKAKKEDRRQFNKGVAPSHSKHLALMVMSKMDNMDNKARTRNGWATYFGVISPAEQDIMKGIYSEEALKPYKEYMIELGIIENGEEQIFQDLANTLKNIVRGHLQTVLDQVEELNLISIISSWKGKVKYSKEPIDIDKAIAMEINNMEAELLKKHGIKKAYSLMFKNSRKTKAFKAEWLEYIENVEDAEGDAMRLQYIYEVFRIEVLNKYAFDEFIKVHYPSEIDSFDLLENEQAYHCKLLDYVVENAQKKHERSLESKNKNLVMDEDTKEVLAMFNITEDEAIAQIEEEEMQRELTPYEALLKSEKYVNCIRNLHLQLHRMSEIECMDIKAAQKMKGEQIEKEFTELGLLKPAEAESKKTVNKGITNYDESSMNANEHKEEQTKKARTEQHQANQNHRKIEIENLEQQNVTISANSNIKATKHYDEKEYYEYETTIAENGYETVILDDEYHPAMEDIRNKIRDYEDKYGDKAMEHMAVDAVIEELTKEVTAEECIAELKQKLLCDKELERKEWDKLFEGEQPVKWRQTTNNPLEVFQRIRNGGNNKEDS